MSPRFDRKRRGQGGGRGQAADTQRRHLRTIELSRKRTHPPHRSSCDQRPTQSFDRPRGLSRGVVGHLGADSSSTKSVDTRRYLNRTETTTFGGHQNNKKPNSSHRVGLHSAANDTDHSQQLIIIQKKTNGRIMANSHVGRHLLH
jgi:hypothetical protein